MTMLPKIQIQNLSLSIERNAILNQVNIDIPANQLTVLLGPSGCGKTTLLRSMNRLIDLNQKVEVEGKILIDGQDVLQAGIDLTQVRKKMGLMSQRPYPLPMSIYNNVAYGMRIHGIRKKAVLDAEVEKHLRQVSLWNEVKDRLKEPASRLSIGQQQRLCLARGLAVNPEIILADEPTSALDPISSTSIEQKFVQLKQDYTIVMVTHVLRQARRIADYVVFMYLGEVIEQGPADEFFNNPQADMTKEYLKGMFN